MPEPEIRLVTLMDVSLPPAMQTALDTELARWEADAGVARLWRKDASLWTGGDEDHWLDWLDIVADELASMDELLSFAQLVEEEGYRDMALLGMGGSSMGPEVLYRVFGAREGMPPLHVIDSTDPDQIRTTETRLDLARTLFIVASKSGSTLEPNLLKDYFHARMVEVVGEQQAGQHFVAITDPGSSLEKVAEQAGFRAIYHGRPPIGGRYSVLSHFGMIPAAGLGMELNRFLERAAVMVNDCRPDVPAVENPGLLLGLVMGVGHALGRDKLTFTTSPAFAGFGAWVEQLVAESTGKQGKAIIPLDGEVPGPPEAYGEDRLFVHMALEGEADEQAAALDALAAAGHPVVRITVPDRYDLGQEFFRWEFATAVAGAVMGIHPFDQPDVEASKVATRALAEAYERDGALPQSEPLAGEDNLGLFTDAANAEVLQEAAGAEADVAALIRAHLARLGPGDYFALLAYMNRLDDSIAESLQAMRHTVRDHHRVATCLGFGPRFLHSTGQAYKGGPNTGVFLQLTATPEQDLPVPGHRYSFGIIESAQALGDLQVLQERGRRVLRVHLGRDARAGLARLRDIITGA